MEYWTKQTNKKSQIYLREISARRKQQQHTHKKQLEVIDLTEEGLLSKRKIVQTSSQNHLNEKHV